MRVFCVGAAVAAILACAPAAHAQRPASLGDGAPTGQMGVQLYDWSQYISNGAGEVNPPAPTTSGARLERVFGYLRSKNIKNVELYGFPSAPFPGTNPATPLNTAGLQALRALGDSYGLRFVSRHGNIAEANWDQEIQAAKILGQEVIGAADPPGIGNLTYQGALSLAELMNKLGKRSVEGGVGPVYFHNHATSFNRKFTDAGVQKYPWEVLMDHTDPRYVKAQIDLFWLASGVSNDAATMLSVVNRYQNRLVSFHVKDGINPTPSAGTGNLRALGDGAVNFAPLFAAAKNRVRYYLYEYDPVTVGNNGGFNPFTTTDRSLANLTGAPAPVAGTNTPSFTSVPAGTAAAANQVPVKVTNIGDAPLVFTAAAPTIAAEADDGGNATAADFAVVSQDCSGRTLAAGEACTINVGYKPTRTKTTSVARLQFNSNSDDSLDRVPLIATSTGDALGGVGGDVPTLLSLNLGTGASFGTFAPATARSYEAATAATVTSTAGNATLTVSDPGANPGRLVNGTFSLPAALEVRATNAASPASAYAPLGATGLNLLTYAAPTAGADNVTVGFRQAIGATDVLRAGNYSKTLTFTLSTTTP